MVEYPKYEAKEGNFLKLSKLIPNEGDIVRLKCVDAKIQDGSFGVKQLVMNVLWSNEGTNEKKVLTCDAPDEDNDMACSQIYRGLNDNNIQENDVFEVVNGGRMQNKFRTVIYNINKDVTQPAPANQEEQVAELTDEDIRIENLNV